MLHTDETILSKIKAKLRGRIAGLDAFRGIAVIWIIWHNTFGDISLTGVLSKVIALFTNSGWAGVQLFFVLSGFLITGILLDLREKQGSLKRKFRIFYFRRSLRIFPLYYFVLIVCFFLLPILGVQHDALEQARESQIWYWTYTVNWAFIPQNGLPHIWSLAIEEQFYLVWPFVVLLLPRPALLKTTVCLIGSALAFRFLLMLVNPDLYDGAGGYTFTIARWDALAFGALLATLVRSDRLALQLVRWSDQALVFSLFLILLVVLVTENFGPTPFGIGVINQSISAAFFALLIFTTIKRDDRNWLNRLLSNSALNAIGKYSYALYIFHLPVRHFWNRYFLFETAELQSFQLLLAGSLNVLGVFSISYLLAVLSWHFLEHPILGYKDRIKY